MNKKDDTYNKMDKRAQREKRVKRKKIRLFVIAGILISLGAVGIVSAVMIINTTSEDADLLVYCGGGMRERMDEIAQKFEEEYGLSVGYTYAGSNTLLSQIELYQQGDVYMPGATYYIEQADSKGFINESKNVAYHIPVIGVSAHYSGPEITSLENFTNPNLKVVFGDPQAAAIGRLGKKILNKSGISWGDVEANINNNDGAFGATVNELVMWLAQGVGDISLVWNSSLYQIPDTEVVEIPEDDNIIKIIPIGTLKFSNKPMQAEKFIDYVASETGKEIYAKHGFTPYNESDPLYSSSFNFKFETYNTKTTLIEVTSINTNENEPVYSSNCYL
jgi:molybdate transport system substrate-binding protein